MTKETRTFTERSILANSVADHTLAMLSYVDKDLVYRFANDAYLYWFGKYQEEMVNKMTMKELWGPVIFEQNLPYILGALNGEPQSFEREIPILNGEGTRYST